MYKLRNSKDLDAMLDHIGDRRIVMLGEASHGTHEFYTWRTAISKRLIAEKGFNFIAVEGDWPDCYGLNCFIKGHRSGLSAQAVLQGFDRWPTWMWANWEVAALGGWLLSHNDGLAEEKKIGFYGLDVYSLWDSMRAILDYLGKEHPDAVGPARQAISCFEPFEGNEQLYARHALSDHSCRDKVLALLQQIRTGTPDDGPGREAVFNAEQNALVAVNAETYYRSMMQFDNESWNVRDTHMMQTLERLLDFHGNGSKAIVWAHNTHIGDARATDMARAGMVNLGQLAREAYGINQVYLAGFGAFSGTVIAATEWGETMKEMQVPKARKNSIEEQLHHAAGEDRYLLFPEDSEWEGTYDHRAIGVVYEPSREHYRNYVTSGMGRRYDAFFYFDKTRALHPLHLRPHTDKIPETYPFGV